MVVVAVLVLAIALTLTASAPPIPAMPARPSASPRRSRGPDVRAAASPRPKKLLTASVPFVTRGRYERQFLCSTVGDSCQRGKELVVIL